MQDCMMFSCWTQRTTTMAAHGTKNCVVCTFSATTCKNDFSWATANQLSNLIAGLIDDFAGITSESMRTRRISKNLIAIDIHRLFGLGSQRRGGGMVKIDVSLRY
jgi:hypothetical protein